MVEKICGTPKETFLKVAEVVTSTGNAQRVGTIMYALGWTQHSIGVQMIRTAAMLQLLLGNVGPARRRRQRLARPLEHPGRDRHRGRLRHPAGLHQDARRRRGRRSRSTSSAEHAEGARPVHELLAELLEVHGLDPEGLLRQERHEGERVRLRVASEGRRQLLLDVHLRRHVPRQLEPRRRPGARPRGPDHVRHEPGRHRPEHAEDDRGALEAEVARGRREPPGRDGDLLEGAQGVRRARTRRRSRRRSSSCPASNFAEKDGSFTNSARWIQWKWKALDPPGQIKTDQEILARIFLAVRELYRKEGGPLPEAVLNVDWATPIRLRPTSSEVLKELNGKALADIHDPKDKTKIIKTAGQQLDGFGQLQDDGSTMCGNWLMSGVLHGGRKHDAAAQQRRPDGPRHVPQLDLLVAGEPARHVQPGLRRRRGQAVGSDAGGHQVERREVGRRRPRHEAGRAPGNVRRLHHAARRRRKDLRAA